MGSSALTAAGWIAAGTGTFVLKPNWAHADGHIKMGIATDITGAIAASGNTCIGRTGDKSFSNRGRASSQKA